MVRDNQKLRRIIMNEISTGWNISNIKYYKNSPLFNKIINAYNEGMPNCLKIKNCTKRRKLVLKQIERIQKKLPHVPAENTDFSIDINDIENNDIINISNISQIFDTFTNLQSTQICEKEALDNENVEQNSPKITISEMEESAINFLMGLNENKISNCEEKQIYEALDNYKTQHQKTEENSIDCLLHYKQRHSTDMKISEMENCAIDALPTPFLQEDKKEKILVSEQKLQKNILASSEFANNEIPIERNVTITLDECHTKILGEIYEDFKSFLNGMVDKTIQAIANGKNESSKNIFENNTSENNIQELLKNKYNCDKNIKCDDSHLENRNKTLGAYEVSDNSVQISKIVEYRKKADPKEKKTRKVIRGEGKRAKPLRKFVFFCNDCVFKVEPTKVFNVKDEQKLNLDKNKLVLDYIREQYLIHNNVCILALYDKKYLKCGYVAYFTCKFPDCCSYRFKISQDGNVIVDRSGDIVHAKDQKFVKQIRGPERVITKNKMQKKGAYMERKEQVLKASDNIAKYGNMQNIQKLATLRKIKSEGNHDTFYHKNPYLDVFYMREGPYKNYIHHLSSPFTVYLWMPQTFEVLNKNREILKDANYTIHLDASGESVRQIECAEKRILTYKMLIRIKKLNKILVISEAILSRHTMDEITSFLNTLKRFCQDNKFKWPFFQRVCTDVSYALFGAILMSCNKQDVSAYMMNCYKFLKSGNMTDKPKVIVQWCKCHYMHIICKDLDKQIGRTHRVRNLLKSVLGIAFGLKTMEECKFWFKQIFTILLYPIQNNAFYDSYNILKNCILECDEENTGDKEINEEEIRKMDSIAMRSPFRIEFKSVYDRVKNDVNDLGIKGPTNEFKNEEMCLYILNKYCAFANFWTNMMGYFVDPSGDLISNAPVEFGFFLQKHILLNDKSVRPGDFIKITRKDNMATLKEIRYEYNMFEENEEDPGDSFILDYNKTDDKNNIIRIHKEHSYSNIIPYLEPEEELVTKNQNKEIESSSNNIMHYFQPEETWGKKNIRKQKSIKPKFLINAKKSKQFISKSEDIHDIIQHDLNLSQEINDISRLNKEHSYHLIDSFDVKKEKSPPQILYYLYRFNDIYKLIYKTLPQSEIGFFNIVDNRDWVTLEKNEMLANFILDFAILCVLKEYKYKNALSLPCQSKEINYEKVNVLLSFKPNFIVIPIVHANHYTLCVLNLVCHEFYYFDSLFDGRGRPHYDRFVEKWKQNKDEVWTFIDVLDRQRQTDEVNCGVFAILYVIRFLKEQNFLNLGDINEFRESIKALLRKNSDNISKFCCHCGDNNRCKVKCQNCNYWVCKQCIKDKHKYNNIFDICKICTNNIKVL